MCPNMNHFDAVDFSECHSEEVISFFWRSVYVYNSLLENESLFNLGISLTLASYVLLQL